MPSWLALARLCDRRLGELAGVRLGRLYSLGILLSFALVMAFFDVASGVAFALRGALESASLVVAGLSTFSGAGALPENDEREGIRQLAALRGASPLSIEAARTFALAARIMLGVALPALGVVAVAWWRTGLASHAGSALALASAVLVYAALLAAVLAVLARSAAHWARDYGRWLLIAALLSLEGISAATGGDVPSLSDAARWAVSRIAVEGEAFV